jgi:energy-coupling factor transporter ATP-binding protein EcfA2
VNGEPDFRFAILQKQLLKLKEEPMLFEIKDLKFIHEDGTVALDGVTANIRAGERIAILGSSPSGKTTLLNALYGLLEPSGGAIFFEGRRLGEKALCDPLFHLEFRSRVGLLCQNVHAHFSFNDAFEEVASWGRIGCEVNARIRKILAPIESSHLSSRPALRMSESERRKLAIASVFAMNPDVILMDEPFAGLDLITRSWLLDLLNSAQNMGKTTIIATNSLDWLPKVADRALVLSADHQHLGTFNVMGLLAELAILNDADLLNASDEVPVFVN